MSATPWRSCSARTSPRRSARRWCATSGWTSPSSCSSPPSSATRRRGSSACPTACRAPVAELIAERAPATLELALCAAALALLVGVPMGVYTGLYRNSWLSRFFLTFSLIGVSLPTFLIGILLILRFSVWLGWLPSFGRGDTVRLGWWSTGLLTLVGHQGADPALHHARPLPADADHAAGAGGDAGGAADDYIKFARARGLSNRAVHFGHALKNTLVPVITITGLQLGAIIAFAIVTETVFQWPGWGCSSSSRSARRTSP
jgi:peptide/nickel transport system permease protein